MRFARNLAFVAGFAVMFAIPIVVHEKNFFLGCLWGVGLLQLTMLSIRSAQRARNQAVDALIKQFASSTVQDQAPEFPKAEQAPNVQPRHETYYGLLKASPNPRGRDRNDDLGGTLSPLA